MKGAVPRQIAEILPVPADDEEFELTITGEELNLSPLSMVNRNNYPDFRLWEFNGLRVSGIQTCRFKLVRAGYYRDLAEVKQKVGELAEIDWSEAFRKKYPKPDGRGPICFGGSVWVKTDGSDGFLCLTGTVGSWGAGFGWSRIDFSRGGRWLMKVST